NISSDTGHISLKAANNISLAADRSVSTATSGTISLTAIAGSLSMHGTASITASESSLRLSAHDNITLGNLTAADVSVLSSAGAILNAVDSSKNVTATNLRLEAHGTIGTADRHISTDVSEASYASETSGIFTTEDNSITIGTVTVTVTGFNADATTTTVTDAAQSGLNTGADGNIVLVSSGGTITVDEAISAGGSGNILLDARGAGSDLTINHNISSDTGHISLKAANNISLAADRSVSTATSGTISLTAIAGSLSMHGTASITASESSLRLSAHDNITLGNLTAADVSVLSSAGAILNAVDSSKNVTATNLRLEAHGTIGTADRHISTDVSEASYASETSGIFTTEDNSITIGTVTVTVTGFNADATTTTVTDAAQSGLNTGADGNIVLVSSGGTITVDQAISAGGSGNILLDASDELTLQGSISSGNGHISLLASNDIVMGASTLLRTAGFGTVDIYSSDGGVRMDDTARITTLSGSLRIHAAESISLGGLQSGNAVSLISTTGGIFSAGDTHREIRAQVLRIEAAQGVGVAATQPVLRTQVSSISIVAGGGINIANSSNLTVGAISVSTQRVGNDGGSTVVSDATQNGLTSGATGIQLQVNGSLALTQAISSPGPVTLNTTSHIRHSFAGPVINSSGRVSLQTSGGIGQTGPGAIHLNADELSVTNTGTGSIYLRTNENLRLLGASLEGAGSLTIQQTSGDLTIADAVQVDSGHLQVNTSGNLRMENAAFNTSGNIDLLATNVDARSSPLTSATGDISIRAASDINLDRDSALSALNGRIHLRSGADMSLAKVSTNGLLNIQSGGNITTSAAGESDRGLTAGSLRIFAAGSVGTPSASIHADVGRIDVEAGQNLHFSQGAGMELGRYGLKVDTAVGEEFRIIVGGGELSSAGGAIIDHGEGTFVLASTQEIIITTVVRSENGSIRIEAERILSGVAAEQGRIEALSGRVTLIAQDGIGSISGGAVYIDAAELSAITTNGTINIESLSAITVAGEGVIAGNGSNDLRLIVQHGDLNVAADIRHNGAGALNVQALNGAILMRQDARMLTTSGSMNLFARNDIRLSQIQSISGQVRLESVTGSILRLSSFTEPNLIATSIPVLKALSLVDLTVLAEQVQVNEIDVFRRSALVITLFLVFG
ncbi:MAG: hypothetical protein JJU20_01490, partial [Opitutales bacterium]|nr:hypothetical protein [Opitutales bacterium]